MVEPCSRRHHGSAGIDEHGEHAHLLGDVPALIIVGIALIALRP